MNREKIIEEIEKKLKAQEETFTFSEAEVEVYEKAIEEHEEDMFIGKCPHCDIQILIRDGENECPRCKKEFIIE